MQIVGKYSKDELARFPEALGALTMAMECAGFDDVLGSVFMEMELGNKWAGQFFTPYSVCKMMALMQVGDVQKHIDARGFRGFITACDPCTGGGAMSIALAEAIHDQKINYQRHLHVTCQDIDIKAVHMTYVQLALLHVPAVVIHGNTLAMEERSKWYTPAHIIGGWNWKLHRTRAPQEFEPQAEPEALQPEPAQVIHTVADINIGQHFSLFGEAA